MHIRKPGHSRSLCPNSGGDAVGLNLPTVIVSIVKTKVAIDLILLRGVDLRNHWIHARIWGLIL